MNYRIANIELIYIYSKYTLNFFTQNLMRRIDRFDKYMEINDLNDNKVTVQLGIAVGTIGKSRKEGRDLSERVVEKILKYYQDINRVWLLTGEGPMLKTEPKISSSDKESINLKNNEEMTNNMLVSMLYDANQRIKRLEAEIEELKQQQGDAIDSPKKRSAI
ncbi:hypothetical protein DWW79_12470 [Alistipes sp. AF17-16]|nr:hypothetical protein DWW79_12470 [Alistipes sp. AF17-16]